uniref:Uncharacterized protein n=1 Tax=Timema genevievae TaxID=629358 RepID=A0A7R9PJI8_TIMGE|nr:unnamed protein product [Timema genevievae]
MQKRISIVIVLIAVIVSVSKASLTSKIVKENKDHPGKCYDTSTKKAYTVDSTWTDEGCTRSSCSIGREKGTYEIFRAGRKIPSTNWPKYQDTLYRVIPLEWKVDSTEEVDNLVFLLTSTLLEAH